MKKFILFSSFIGLSVFAHEGDHHEPSQVQAPKGGVMRSLETVHLELLSEGKSIKIYAYNLELKPDDVKKYPVSATVALPKKKPQTINLTAAQDHWTFEFDPKNAHRYTLEMSIKQGGHDDKIKWVIEPKK